ncbi:hypothetical protein ACF0H5_009113 [Mactra antiquata]
MTELNDVSAYLNELIPYRCPKCGNLRRFATLRELRQHLQIEHSFQMGFIKPHSRACVFKRSNNGNYGDIQHQNRRSSIDNDISTRKDNRVVNQMSDFRDSSPLLSSFKSETELLEKELQLAIQTEMKHKTSSMQNLTNNSINTDCHNTLNTILAGKPSNRTGVSKPSLKSDQHNHQLFEEKRKVPIFPHIDQPTITPLSHINPDIHQSYLNQWITRDSLRKSHDLLHEMENTVENKCQEQRDVIQQLIQDMKIKDEQMELNKKKHSDLMNEREKLLREQEALMQESDDFNNKLKDDLSIKHTELDTLDEDMKRFKKLSEHQLHLKSKDLQQATERASRLEQERNTLIQETERILKHADSDNERLKKQLHKKELELRNVNENLRQIRSHQEEMLEKTVGIYKNCEDSKEMMHTAINTKDLQLQQAKQQIEEMANMQRRLVEQSHVLTDQADDNTANMKHLLQTKAKQMEQLVTQLETLKSEKRNLEKSTACLTEKSESSRAAVESLQQIVKQRENDLKTTQSELQHLKTFLKSAADKERIARQKLEVFIEDLIYRAERAESELRSLKSQSSDTLNKVDPLNTDSHNDVQPEDTTDRNSLPARLENIHQEPKEEPENTFMPATFVDDSVDFVKSILQNRTNKQNGDDRDNLIADTNGKKTNDMLVMQIDNVMKSIEIVDSPTADKQTTSTNVRGFQPKKMKGLNKSRNIIQYKINDDNSKPHNTDYINNLNDRWRCEPTTSPTNVYMTSEINIEDEDHCFSNDEHIRLPRNYDGKPNGIDRNVQVGSYLSMQSEYDNLSDDCFTDEFEHDERNEEHRSSQNDEYKQVERKRPATIGKSYQNAKVMKKKLGVKKKATLNDGFDTNLPDVHRSMIEITRDSRDLSEGEVRLRDRRSRSLSPRTMDDRKFFVDQNATNFAMHKYLKRDIIDTRAELDEETEYSVDASVIDGLSRDKLHDQHSRDQTDGIFNNIMDENGILWDDDNATLPDVSDSELDRVSPSGSEAISSHRKSTPNVTTAIESKTNTRNNSTVIRSNNYRPEKRNELHVSPSTSSVVGLLNSSTLKDFGSDNITTKTFQKRSDAVRRQKHTKREKGIPHRKERKEAMSKALFKPISSSPDNKSSISDKDMTSGGREINSYMRNTPKIEQEYLTHTFSPTKSHSNAGASESMSVEFSQCISRDDLNDNTNHDYRTVQLKTETTEETINRISRKYSPKRTKHTVESEPSSTINDKISSISEKYKIRRQNILEGKGVRTIVGPEQYSLSASPLAANRRFIGSKSDTNINNTRTKSAIRTSVSSGQQNTIPTTLFSPFGYMPYPPNASNIGSPQPLPFVHFSNMSQYPGFVGMPYGSYGNLHNMTGSIPYPGDQNASHSISTNIIKTSAVDTHQPQHTEESVHLVQCDITVPNPVEQTENVSVPKELPHDEIAVPKCDTQTRDTENTTHDTTVSVNMPVSGKSPPRETDSNEREILTPSANDNKHSDDPVSVSESLSYLPFKGTKVEHPQVGNQSTSQIPMANQFANGTDASGAQILTNPMLTDCHNAVTNRSSLNSSVESQLGENDTTDVSEPTSHHLKLFTDVDTIDCDEELSKFSMFAETIDDDHTSIECDTNSFLDLPGTLTESELDGDTDTESARRFFYEKSQHVKDLLESSTKVRNDITGHRKAAMSSASSQG